MNDVKLLSSDVWLEILRRIPAADLVPLKAICKTFYRLISSDFFAQIHLEYFTKAKRAMIIFTTTSEKDHPKPFHSNYYDPDKRTITVWHDEPRFGDWCSHVFPHRHCHRVIDSYRGILLVQICDRLLLCNPIIRSYKLLPSFSEVDCTCWKIAYDDVSKQYKVFGLRRMINEFSMYVFDVHREGESRSLRKTKVVKFEERCPDLLMESVLVNESVYWLIIAKWWNNTTYIVSVNVTTEEVKTRSCSSTPLILTRNYDHFFAANGTFYLEKLYDPKYDLQLWVLEGFESVNPNPNPNLNPSWMIKRRIKKSWLFSIPRKIDGHAVGVFRNKMLIMVDRYRRQTQLYQYDLGNEEYEKVTMPARYCGVVSFVYFRIVEHIDSLLSL